MYLNIVNKILTKRFLKIMDYKELKEGQKVFFIGEKLPMELIAKTERYAVVVRSLDKKEDSDILDFEVRRGAYSTKKKAYEEFKNEPVYSLLDFKEGKRAPSNLIFNPYDFFSKEGCVEAVNDLENGTHELSRRNGCDLNIDWERSFSIKH